MHKIESSLDSYLNNSSIHGLKYISKSAGPGRLHRCFWFISVLLAVGAAAYFISHVYVRYINDPVLMSLSPTSTPIYEIPFPALVFCNVNNIRKSEVLRINASGSEEERKMVLDICQSNRNTNETADYLTDRVKLKTFIINVSQRCSKMIYRCLWRGKPIDNCRKTLFVPDMTDEGLCCVFNRLSGELIYNDWPNHLQENETFRSIPWTPERGFLPSDPEDNVVPWRVLTSGVENGLSIIFDTELDEYYCTPQLSVGIKVKAHSPNEAPDIASNSILVSPGQESRLAFYPRLITANSQISNIPVSKRNCFFSNERQLKYFKSYTEANCRRECFSIYTLKKCGCVLYYMPGSSNEKICSRISESCYEAARDKLFTDMRASKMGSVDTTTEACNCLPNCFEINYAASVTANPIISEDLIERMPQILGKYNASYFKKNMAVLQIFFSRSHITPYQRGLLFGFTDLVANTGGLLGLFMGFSILSLIEIIYFFSLKLCCKAEKKKVETSSKSTQSSQIDNLNLLKNQFTIKMNEFTS